MDAYQILGVPEGSIKGKTELEKVRQRSKELYKRYAAEKKDEKAKRVLEAWEVINTRYKKAHGSSKEPSAKPATTSNGSKPAAGGKPAAAKPAAPSGTATARGVTGVAQKQSAIQKDLASLRSQFGGVDKGKTDEADAKKASAGASVRPSGGTKPSSQEKKPGDKVTVLKPKSTGDAAAGTSSMIRGPGGVLSLGVVKKPVERRKDHAAGSNGKTKRPSSQDIPFCPGKRDAVAAKLPSNNGTDKQARLTCKCGASYGASRFQGATGTFLCPGCRFRSMDPLNLVIKGSKGMLNLKLVQRPIVPEDAKHEATFKFKMDVTEIKEWRKLGDNVEARMCRLDCFDAYQCWPNFLSFKVNGKPAFTIKEPKPGHKRRDLPHRISPNLKPGLNVFEVNVKDQNVQNFALALLRTRPQVPKDMCKHVPCVGVEDCKQKVMDLMFASSLDGCIEDTSTAVADRSRLFCPISLMRIKTPARGKKCRHLQCFDLEAYLVSNQRMSAINKRWRCPVCDVIVKPPGDLFIDTFFVQILAETGQYDEEVAFDSTGAWTVSSVAVPLSESEDELPVVAVPMPVSSPLELADDVSDDVAMGEEQPGKADQSDVEAVEIEDLDGAVADENDAPDADAAVEASKNDVDSDDAGDDAVALASDDGGGADDAVAMASDDGADDVADDKDLPANSDDAAEDAVVEKAILHCTSGHPLAEYSAHTSGSCDGNCGTRIAPGQHVMDCRPCNYWLCDSCSGFQAGGQDHDRPAAEGEPMGSPSASSPANWGSGSPGAESDGEGGGEGCQEDPYMMNMKDDDEVDEDFVATLRGSTKSRGNGKLMRTMSMSMIATPAPLASPPPGSPGEVVTLASPEPGSPAEASDPDDPLGLDKSSSKRMRVLGKCTSKSDLESAGIERQMHDGSTTVLS